MVFRLALGDQAAISDPRADIKTDISIQILFCVDM